MGVYTIQKGNTLFRIAQQCKVTVEELVRMNPEIKDPNKIYVGQVIRVTDAFESAHSTSSTAEGGSTVTAPADNAAGAAAVCTAITKLVANGIEGTSSLQTLSKLVAMVGLAGQWKPETLEAANNALEAFEPQDGAQIHLKDGLLFDLTIAKLLPAGLQGTADLERLAGAFGRAGIQDPWNTASLDAAAQELNAFQPQDGAQANYKHGLLFDLAVAKLLSKGIQGSADLQLVAALLSEGGVDGAWNHETLDAAAQLVSEFEPQDGAESHLKDGLTFGLAVAKLAEQGIESTADLQELAQAAQAMEELQTPFDPAVLEVARRKLGEFEPQDGAQFNLKNELLAKFVEA